MSPFGNPEESVEKQRRDMEATLEALERLLVTPGWAVLKNYLENELSSIEATMANVPVLTGETALKTVVAHGILKRVIGLPKSLATQIQQSLAPQQE